MGIESIIELIIKTGIAVAPRIAAFFHDLHGPPPTQSQIDAVWARHRAAYEAIMSEDPSTHPGG